MRRHPHAALPGLPQRLLLAALVLWPALTFAQAARTPAFTVDEMLKLERLSDPQLSPDGSRVAFVITAVDQTKNTRNSDIWIVATSGGAPLQVTRSEQSDDRPRWSPDGRRLSFVSSREGGSQIWVMDVDGAGKAGEPRKLTSIATEASGQLWSPDGKWVAFVSSVFPDCRDAACNVSALKQQEESKVKAKVLDTLMFRHWTSWRDGRFSHLFLVPADGSTAPRDLTSGAADVPPFSLGGPEDYGFSPDSKEIAFARKTDAVEAIGTNSDLFVVAVDSPGAQPKKITDNPGADGGPVYSPDGRFIAYRAQAQAGSESDRWQLMILDRTTGQRRAAAPAFDRWVESYVFAPDGRTIYLTADEGGRTPIFALDLSGGAPRSIVSDGANGDVQVTPDGRTLVFSRSTLMAPTEILRAASTGGAVTSITKVNDARMTAYRLQKPESITYVGAGGARVQGWIVKPAGFDSGRKYPLLLLVHGGPQGVWGDAWSYRWNPQVFAAEGYVVFMPNPRGSVGFGQQFITDITADWAGKVYEDVMKGVDYMVSLPYVDGSRIGAAGGSYGGYMMNWMLGHTDRFKAIVSHAGVFNLSSMYGATEELWFPEWEFKGAPWQNPDLYEKLSPHRYAQNFKTPTLVTHGEIDFRVPIGEGLQLFTTLQRLGVPSKMLYFPDEGHWINKPQNSALWYRTFVEWMNRWVKSEEKSSR